MSPDSRDWTPQPAVFLSPLWILRMRQRLQEFMRTGNMDWFENRMEKAYARKEI